MRGVNIGVLYELKDKLSGGLNRIKQRMGEINKLKDRAILKTKEYGNSFAQSLRGAMPSLDAFKMKNAQMFEALESRVPFMGQLGGLLSNPYVLAVGAVVALIGILGKATTAAADFNHEFLDIRQLNLDKTSSQLTDYRDLILDTAYQTGTAAKSISKSFYDIQSGTGLFGQDVADLTTQVAMFSKATKADLADSTNSVIKSMKTFGFGVKDVNGYLESNAKTVQVGITTFDELAKVQTEFAGAAKAAGQDFNVANKLFAAFTASAKDGQIAANLTKTAFQGLTLKPTVDGLKGIGISLFDAQGQMRKMDEVINELTPKIAAMSDEEFLAWRNAIGGPEGLQSLFNNLRTSGEDVLKTMKAFDESQFSIDKAVKNAKDDFVTMRKEIGAKIGVMLIRIGDEILPAVSAVLKGIWWLFEKIASLVSTIWRITKMMLNVFIRLGEFLWGKIASFYTWLGDKIQWIYAKLGGEGNIWERMFGALDRWQMKIRVFFEDLYDLGSKTFRFLEAGLAGDLETAAKLFKELNGFKWRDASKLSEQAKAASGIVDPNNPDAIIPPDDTTTGSIADKSVQQRNVTVNIGALNSGGITLHTKNIQESGRDIEDAFMEMLIRAVRNVEQTI